MYFSPTTRHQSKLDGGRSWSWKVSWPISHRGPTIRRSPQRNRWWLLLCLLQSSWSRSCLLDPGAVFLIQELSSWTRSCLLQPTDVFLVRRWLLRPRRCFFVPGDVVFVLGGGLQNPEYVARWDHRGCYRRRCFYWPHLKWCEAL